MAPFVLADIRFTSPAAGATIAGGRTLTIEWEDSGEDPPLSELTTYELFLCAGGNDPDSFQPLAPIVPQGRFSTGNSATGTTQVNLGGSDKNAYFLKMMSAAPGGTVINYSDRFTLTGMTGSFPEKLQTGIDDIKGTSGPKTENNIKDDAAGAPADSGLYGTPFAMQTGLTRYAPMPRKPGSKITMETPSMLYPTSAADIAKSALPTPEPVTTMTMSLTNVKVTSIENTALADSIQRRHFLYLSGCLLPDCHLTYHMPTDSLTLFIPPLDPESVIWSGLPLSPGQALEEYDIDACLPTTELAAHLSSLGSKTENGILAHTGRGELPMLRDEFKHVEDETLHAAIDACRVTKDAYEVALLKKANEITTAAHTAALKAIKTASNETELEAAFVSSCISLGAKNQAYHGIFGSGTNAATLHYQANNESLQGRRNVLVDAAAEWHGYCADVTRTMPLHRNGFDRESAQIYVIVEKMQEACFLLLKAGVRWEDVHMLAHEVAVEGLLSIGLLKGDKAKILARRTSVAFFPHGLGHYLGLDTHDTGGNPNYEDKDPMFKYLRVRGILPEHSVITVEPGIYFCRFIVKPYLEDERHKCFIDEEVLNRYWEVGGVRIEDDVLITKEGYENLTTATKGIGGMMAVINS
ncbi:MAG: hypothetical protein Q9163_003688 [Psora crenata]